MQDSSVIAHGVPSWVDLGSPDTAASTRFYGDLFGWTATEPTAEAGGYFMFLKDGKHVAGIAPLMSPQQPPAWMTYMAVDDADAVAEKVRAAGGQAIVEPMDVMTSGRFAVFADPTGAVFGIWQAKDFAGAELFNAPGAVCWNELATPDLSRASRFYAETFGWGTREMGQEGQPYTGFLVGDRAIAGGQGIGGQVPAGTPPHWLTYFAIDDLARGLDSINANGGRVQMGPFPSPFGSCAIVADPGGATFALIELAPSGG